MKVILRHPSLYLAAPFVGSILINLFIFHVPASFIPWMVFFLALVTLVFLLDTLLLCGIDSPDALIQQGLKRISMPYNNANVQLGLTLGIVVLAACIIDLKVNGLKILDATNYADLTSRGALVRHISNMCWIFVPLAFFSPGSPWLRRIFFFASLVFPILFVDRNRLIEAAFCFIWMKTVQKKGMRSSSIKTLVLIFFILALFVSIGFVRSGVQTFVVPSSGTLLLENEFPLRHWFLNFPVAIQQVLLYISVPLFNFATVAAAGYRDTSLLFAQLFSSLGFKASEHAVPVLVARYNVGTEFFPFLMCGGAMLSAIAFVGMFIAVFSAHLALVRRPNIFSLLIYLRIVYCCLMSGFAPQFYTWTNIDFVLMCIFLSYITPLLTRHATCCYQTSR